MPLDYNINVIIPKAADLGEKAAKLEAKLPSIMQAAALHVKGKVAKYPPATDANSPRSFQSAAGGKKVKNSWYERGFGTKWARKNGSVGGKRTSETLGRKWTIEIREGGRIAMIGNNVSYAQLVQGPETQEAFHAAHGWKTTSQVATEEALAVEKITLRAVIEAMK